VRLDSLPFVSAGSPAKGDVFENGQPKMRAANRRRRGVFFSGWFSRIPISRSSHASSPARFGADQQVDRPSCFLASTRRFGDAGGFGPRTGGTAGQAPFCMRSARPFGGITGSPAEDRSPFGQRLKTGSEAHGRWKNIPGDRIRSADSPKFGMFGGARRAPFYKHGARGERGE